MVMRDPGTPGRNPFFDHELSDEAFESDDPHDDPHAGPWADADPFAAFRAAAEPGALGALVQALQDAQPEAAEHLVAAAHEVVLAVKTVVDAAEAALAYQRAAMHDARTANPSSFRPDRDDDPEPDPDPGLDHTADPPAPQAPPTHQAPPTAAEHARVRRIDLA